MAFLLETDCLQHVLFDMKRPTEVSEYFEQWIVIKFCVKLGWNFTQIKTALHSTFGQVFCDASVYKWMAKFRGGRDSVVDNPRASKPKTGCSRAKIWRVETLVSEDRRVTLRELSVKTGIPTSTVQRILKFDLKLTKKCAK